MNSYSSIRRKSARASASLVPATKRPLPGSPFELLNGVCQVSLHELGVPIDPVQRARHDVLSGRVDRSGEREHPVGARLVSHEGSPERLHHFVGHAAEEQRIGTFQVGDGMAMQLFIPDHHLVIAAAVERDIDRISQRSHARNVHQGAAFSPPRWTASSESDRESLLESVKSKKGAEAFALPPPSRRGNL
jgi:hypothetical protein